MNGAASTHPDSFERSESVPGSRADGRGRSHWLSVILWLVEQPWTVCRYVQMKPGDRHLDVGCGWGALLAHAAAVHGTESTGVTLAKEQAEWAAEVARKAGVGDRVRIVVDDYRNLPNDRYDKITCLEQRWIGKNPIATQQ